MASNQGEMFSSLLAVTAFLREQEEKVLREAGILSWGQGLDVIITVTNICTSHEMLLCKTSEHEKCFLPCPFSRGGN